MDFLKIGGRTFKIEKITVFSRTSSVRLVNGQIVMRFSRYLSSISRAELLLKFRGWAEKKLTGILQGEKYFVRPFGDVFWRNPGALVTHNKIYGIERYYCANLKSLKVSFIGDSLLLKFPSLWLDKEEKFVPIVRDKVEAALAKVQLAYLKNEINDLNQLYFQERLGIVRFKRRVSRFGSCSNKRNINIALRLLYAPREVFRYVCIHELAHLREMNHSRAFWNLVAEAMPDYRVQEKWLKDYGFLLADL